MTYACQKNVFAASIPVQMVFKSDIFLPFQMELEDSGQQKVIALQNYTPQGDNDLPLQKDQEYLLVKNSHSTWWLVQDERG